MNSALVEAFDRPPRYSTYVDPVPSENELPTRTVPLREESAWSNPGKDSRLVFQP
ncbi:MAG: hypothetical protein JOZ33_16015 [Acidobacteriaceae bacterium]|nr:hypothetical protein [Acidobacteriaceae bacterium]